ncbi:DUF3800 domain-containing protein [Rhodobacteraceae bacterium 2376]|uniref:DUF3800 domain-containing protein n=1 Tax=Rhabdonatronobacter sediminivivens TaxID=2743469 RepID=A0A7Z0I267_9RHOB|nr:DUF3800 domain-containing protein [Rhabdonatronobacter sediminivivens]NYS26553.1 DUF3800 domain-containing protein [Rhabdonatronobacter sediminivivens]
MSSEFIAFIDEAGCSGDKFGRGSSQFLVMGAVIVRRSNLSSVLNAFDEARKERGKGADISFRKFAKASEKDNFVLTRLLGRKPIKTAFIGFHKPSLAGTHIRANHGSEYNYLTKFMLERVSWAVRDAPKPCGDHTAEVVFSHQDMYPLHDLQDYIERLKRGSGRYNTRANWEHLSAFTGEAHSDEGRMHLADLAASSFHMAIEPKMHNMTDERHFGNLLPRLYRGAQNKPFGLKMWPEAAVADAQKAGRMLFLNGL